MARLCAPAESFSSYTFSRCEMQGEYTSSYASFFTNNIFIGQKRPKFFRLRTSEQPHTGTSPFESLSSLDMIQHFPVDHMHCVFLRAIKQLLDLRTRGSRAHGLSPSAVKIKGWSILNNIPLKSSQENQHH